MNHMSRRYDFMSEYRSLELFHSAPRGARNLGNNDGHWIAVDEEGDVAFSAFTRKEIEAKIDRNLDMTVEEATALYESVERVRNMLASKEVK